MRDELGSNHGWRSVARAIQGAAVTLCLLVHGCDNAQGGAVELSWKLRPTSSASPDKFVECKPAPPSGSDVATAGEVTRIRLSWTVPVGASIVEGAHDWPCQDNHGVTGFELPEGTAELSIAPVCHGEAATAELAAPDTYIAPAPVQRRVILGDTVSLGAVELVVAVDCATPGEPCICKPP